MDKMTEEEKSLCDAIVRDVKYVVFFFLWSAIAVFIGIQYERQVNPCADIQYIKGKDSIVYMKVIGDTTVNHPKPTITITYAHNLPNIDKSDSVNWTNNVQSPCDDSIRVYVTNKVDSLVSIHVTDSVQGKLLSTRITSQMQKVYIYRTDTIIKEKSINNNGPIFGPWAKVRSGAETSFTIGGLYAKNRTGYIVGYDINTKAVEVGLFLNFRK
jgi:hypothetical protein